MTKQVNIWLDDERDPKIHSPGDKWIWVKLSEDAIQALKDHGMDNVARLSLDHDLGSGVVPGYAVLLWIEGQVGAEHKSPPKWMYAHTANPSARLKMNAAIRKIYELHDANRG